VTTQTLPHNDAAERILLGTILRHPETLTEAAEIVTSPRAFYDPKHSAIWAAIGSARDAGAVPDLVTVATILRDREQGDLVALASALEDEAGPAGNVGWYARKIVAEWRKRDAAKELQGALTEALNGGSTTELAALVSLIGDALADPIGQRELRTVSPGDVLGRDPEPIAWLAEGWIARGDSCILAGEWGTGKSIAAMDLALSLATGAPWLGAVRCASCPVLYVDEENNDRNIRRRMRQLMLGRGIDAERADGLPILYLSRNGVRLDEPEWMTATHRLIDRLGAQVLILDSLVRFSGSDENSNSEVSRFFDKSIKPLMIRHDLAVVMLDHMRKPASNPKHDSDPGHRVRGASDKPGFVDELIVLEGDRAGRTRTLRHEKGRSDHLQPALSLTWTVSDDETAAVVTATEEQRGSEAVILSALSEAGPDGLLRADILARLAQAGFTDRMATKALGKLHGQGTIKKAPAGDRTVRYWPARLAPIDAK